MYIIREEIDKDTAVKKDKEKMMGNIKCFLYLLLVFSITGCSQSTALNRTGSVQQSSTISVSELETSVNSTNFENSLPVADDIYDVAVDITSYLDGMKEQPFGFMDSKYILVYNFDNNDFEKIDIKNGKRESIHTLSEGQRAITCQYDNNVIVWAEDGETESDGIIGKKWGIYAFNLLTKEVITIEKENEKTTPSNRVFCATPNEMTCKDGSVVYTARQYYKGKLCLVIKLFKIDTGELVIIDSVKFKLDEPNDTWINIPSSNKNYVAYSISKAILDELTEFGEIYLYNINENSKTHLITSNNLLHPQLCDNYIIARMKPEGQNENSEIWVYDIEANRWIASITKESKLYEGYIVKPFELVGLIPSSDLFTWHESTYSAAIGVANLKKFELIPVTTKRMNKIITIRMFNNGMLLWNEFGRSEEIEKSRYKYVVFNK